MVRKQAKTKQKQPRPRRNGRIKHKFPDTILMGNFLIHLRIDISAPDNCLCAYRKLQTAGTVGPLPLKLFKSGEARKQH
jgi:hypothetical protein